MTSLWFKHERLCTWAYTEGEWEERRKEKDREGRIAKGLLSFCLLAFSLLLLLLSVCDDIADVLVVYVASNIRGEGGPHVLNLREKSKVGNSPH